MNNQVNHDLKTLVNLLKANNICVNVDGTELVIFTSPSKQLVALI